MLADTNTQAIDPDARRMSWWDPPHAEAAEDPFDRHSLARMPGLAAPFALVGAAAAFFSILALGAMFDPMLEASPALATAIAVMAGAAAGTTLRRWHSLHDPFRSRDSRAVRVAFVIVIAGAAIGSALGLTTWGWSGGVPCAVGGALSALAFIPSSLVVLDASQRAARARLGSLVAEVDRRTIFVTLLGAIAFAAAIQAPALALARYSEGVRPLLQIGVSLAVGATCSAAVAWLRRRDLEARSRFAEIVRDAPWLDRAEASEHAIPEAIDLGLGADRWSRASATATYRTACRHDVIFQGSVEDARRALDQALAHRRRALVFTLAMIAVTASSVLVGELVRARAW